MNYSLTGPEQLIELYIRTDQTQT